MRYFTTGFMLFVFTLFLNACNEQVLESMPAPSNPGSASTVISCDFPTDIPAAGASQEAFDQYSWRMFTALNQPVGTVRGEPDCSQGPGSSSDVVWRSYKFVGEIFLPGAKNPGPWDVKPNILKKVFRGVSKVSPDVDKTINQPVGGWLIDQRQNPTYYQIAANKISYDYIVSNGLYNKNTAEKFSLINFPDFATEIKASWRILTPSDTSERYMTTTATIATFDSAGKENGIEEVTLGLVGLHIITKAAGFPQWVWATFEQVDNVSEDAVHFSSYYNASATPDQVNQSPCANRESPCVPATGTTFQTPDPLARVTPIDKVTAQVNQSAQSQLDTNFLQYYQLITTQRAADPNDPGNPAGSPTPAVSANTTMESYIQPTSSCMDCHSTAVVKPGKKSDYSFLFLHAKKPSNTAFTQSDKHNVSLLKSHPETITNNLYKNSEK